MPTKCRLNVEKEGLQLHKNIITMITEVLESNNLKQVEDVISHNLVGSLPKQKEYNKMLDEVKTKIHERNFNKLDPVQEIEDEDSSEFESKPVEDQRDEGVLFNQKYLKNTYPSFISFNNPQ